MTPEGFVANISYDAGRSDDANWHYRVYSKGALVGRGWCYTYAYASYMVENVLHRVLHGAAA